jgi:hypothetical protein
VREARRLGEIDQVAIVEVEHRVAVAGLERLNDALYPVV